MIFEHQSGIYTLKTEQVLPITIKTAWEFFSDPENLETLTPKDLSFEITKDELPEIYEGQIVTYRIGILPFIKSNWVTEITHAKQYNYFIDEQRFGPYKMWHHRHQFIDLDGEVLMFDEVNFKLPYGILGRMVSPLIKKKLSSIFAYRYAKLNELFPRTDKLQYI